MNRIRFYSSPSLKLDFGYILKTSKTVLTLNSSTRCYSTLHDLSSILIMISEQEKFWILCATVRQVFSPFLPCGCATELCWQDLSFIWRSFFHSVSKLHSQCLQTLPQLKSLVSFAFLVCSLLFLSPLHSHLLCLSWSVHYMLAWRLMIYISWIAWSLLSLVMF